MSCSQKAELGFEAIANASGRYRGKSHPRGDFLLGWRIHVWRGAKAALGKEDASGRAQSDSAGGQLVAGAHGRKECFGGDRKRDEVGREAAEHLWVCGG